MFLELRHLRSLKVIARSATLAQAAEQLHLTPSALSHQIRVIEDYFEASLFLRQHKPLHLTRAGKRLVALAEQVLPAMERTERELHSLALGESGRLHITIECHACFEWLLPTLERYRRDWPTVEVDIRLGMSFTPLPALTRGEIDLVISSDTVTASGVRFEPMFAYEARLAVARDHPLAVKAFVQARDLGVETLITYPVERARLDVFRRFLQPAGVEPAAVRQAELTSMILQLVAVRQGVAVLPDWALREVAASGRLATCALGPEGMHGILYAAVREQEVNRPYVKAFIALARSLNGGDDLRLSRKLKETSGQGNSGLPPLDR